MVGDLEPPETPAPVFALRAFRTALFGTPQDTPENRMKNVVATDQMDEDLHTTHETNEPYNQAGKTRISERNNETPRATQFRTTASPTKGILLTPGTAATRRKTVSFGAAVLEQAEKKESKIGKSGLPVDYPGKYPSPWTPKVHTNQTRSGQTKLTKSFMEAKKEGSSTSKVLTDKSTTSSENSNSKPTSLVQDLGSRRETVEPERSEKPATYAEIPIEKDEAQSGRFWKQEFEEYRAKTYREMKKLIAYQKAAKSYAMTKDSQALRLAEKLRKEKSKVAETEAKVFELAVQLKNITAKDNGTGIDVDQLLTELAKQTKLAAEYKNLVQQFEESLMEDDQAKEHHERKREPASPRTRQTLIETSQELKKARESLQKMGQLQEESERLRQNLKTAEGRVEELDRDKKALQNNLIRVKEEMEKFEQRRKVRDEKQKQREERLQVRAHDYKDQLEQARRSHEKAEAELRTVYSAEIDSLKKQLLSLTSTDEAEKKESHRQPDFPHRPVKSQNTFHTQNTGKREPQDMTKSHRNSMRAALRFLEPQVNSSQLVRERDEAQRDFEEVTRDLKQLLQGAGNKSPETLKSDIWTSVESPTLKCNAGDDLKASLRPVLTETSINPPALQLKGSKRSLSEKTAAMKHGLPSNTEHDPHNTDHSTTAILPDTRERVRATTTSRASSLNSSRARLSLPPERAAAAKARLQQRKREAEKKRSQLDNAS